MTTFISRYRERQIKRSIRKRFNSPIPPDSKRYPHDKPAPPLTVSEFLAALFTQFFTLFAVVFQFNAPQVFRKLRKHWNINEEEYQKSFQEPLETISGNKGLSGASFFITKNQKYLIKSLDRKFEWEYYYEHLLMPLSKYQLSHPESEIVHMTDALFNFAPRLGRILRTSPSNFLIMENSREGEGWEDYDLKPTNYFYPERDFLGGKLTSQEHKERLHDIFEGHIDLHAKEYEKLMKSLEEDAQFLSDMEAIDYSLFVIRRKHGKYDGAHGALIDSQGEWEYKFTILDFFRSHKMGRTKAIKLGVKLLGHGHMTITAPAEDYRKEWLKMVKENIRNVDDPEVKENMRRESEDTI